MLINALGALQNSLRHCPSLGFSERLPQHQASKVRSPNCFSAPSLKCLRRLHRVHRSGVICTLFADLGAQPPGHFSLACAACN